MNEDTPRWIQALQVTSKNILENGEKPMPIAVVYDAIGNRTSVLPIYRLPENRWAEAVRIAVEIVDATDWGFVGTAYVSKHENVDADADFSAWAQPRDDPNHTDAVVIVWESKDGKVRMWNLAYELLYGIPINVASWEEYEGADAVLDMFAGVFE